MKYSRTAVPWTNGRALAIVVLIVVIVCMRNMRQGPSWFGAGNAGRCGPPPPTPTPGMFNDDTSRVWVVGAWNAFHAAATDP